MESTIFLQIIERIFLKRILVTFNDVLVEFMVRSINLSNKAIVLIFAPFFHLSQFTRPFVYSLGTFASLQRNLINKLCVLNHFHFAVALYAF